MTFGLTVVKALAVEVIAGRPAVMRRGEECSLHRHGRRRGRGTGDGVPHGAAHAADMVSFRPFGITRESGSLTAFP